MIELLFQKKSQQIGLIKARFALKDKKDRLGFVKTITCIIVLDTIVWYTIKSAIVITF